MPVSSKSQVVQLPSLDLTQETTKTLSKEYILRRPSLDLPHGDTVGSWNSWGACLFTQDDSMPSCAAKVLSWLNSSSDIISRNHQVGLSGSASGARHGCQPPQITYSSIALRIFGSVPPLVVSRANCWPPRCLKQWIQNNSVSRLAYSPSINPSQVPSKSSIQYRVRSVTFARRLTRQTRSYPPIASPLIESSVNLGHKASVGKTC